jgi:peptide/nickel transport system permease protein
MRSMRWFVIRRLAWTITASWVFLTVSWIVLVATPDPNLTWIRFGLGNDPEAQRQAVEAYMARRGRTGTLLERYLDWVIGFATFDYGHSALYDKPVSAVLARRVPVTLAYLLPSFVVASTLSVVTGVFGAIRKGSLTDRLTNGVAYLGLGIPAFVVAVFCQRYFDVPQVNPALGLFDPQNLVGLAFPALVLGLNLYAVQSWAVRAEAIEIVPAEFVKTLRANGAGNTRLARHVLRNAVAPVFALLVSELLVLLFVGVYVVELVFDVPGAATASFQGFRDRDFALILATVVLPVMVALVANLVLDVISAYVDPRVSHGGDGA